MYGQEIIGDLGVHDLLNLIYQRFGSFQTLWSIYSTVVFGILAALISFPKHLNSKLTRIILIIGFAVFSQANLGALLSVQQDRLHILDELKEVCACKNETIKEEIVYAKGIQTLVCEKELQSKGIIRVFHLFQDFLIILLIWILPKSLVRIQLFKSISNLKIKIRGSSLPNPVISWDQENKIWVLEEKISVGVQVKNISDDLKLQIPEKFQFDLATIPRFLWSLIAPFELSIIAPLVHDFLYVQKGKLYIDQNNNMTKEVTNSSIYISRLETDRIFLDHMQQEGVSKIKRYLCYYGVRIFGSIFWKEDNEVI